MQDGEVELDFDEDELFSETNYDRRRQRTSSAVKRSPSLSQTSLQVAPTKLEPGRVEFKSSVDHNPDVLVMETFSHPISSEKSEQVPTSSGKSEQIQLTQLDSLKKKTMSEPARHNPLLDVNGKLLPPDWESRISSSTGEMYYRDGLTGKSSWIIPTGIKFTKPPASTPAPLPASEVATAEKLQPLTEVSSSVEAVSNAPVKSLQSRISSANTTHTSQTPPTPTTEPEGQPLSTPSSENSATLVHSTQAAEISQLHPSRLQQVSGAVGNENYHHDVPPPPPPQLGEAKPTRGFKMTGANALLPATRRWGPQAAGPSITSTTKSPAAATTFQSDSSRGESSATKGLHADRLSNLPSQPLDSLPSIDSFNAPQSRGQADRRSSADNWKASSSNGKSTHRSSIDDWGDASTGRKSSPRSTKDDWGDPSMNGKLQSSSSVKGNGESDGWPSGPAFDKGINRVARWSADSEQRQYVSRDKADAKYSDRHEEHRLAGSALADPRLRRRHENELVASRDHGWSKPVSEPLKRHSHTWSAVPEIIDNVEKYQSVDRSDSSGPWTVFNRASNSSDVRDRNSQDEQWAPRHSASAEFGSRLHDDEPISKRSRHDSRSVEPNGVNGTAPSRAVLPDSFWPAAKESEPVASDEWAPDNHPLVSSKPAPKRSNQTHEYHGAQRYHRSTSPPPIPQSRPRSPVDYGRGKTSRQRRRSPRPHISRSPSPPSSKKSAPMREKSPPIEQTSRLMQQTFSSTSQQANGTDDGRSSRAHSPLIALRMFSLPELGDTNGTPNKIAKKTPHTREKEAANGLVSLATSSRERNEMPPSRSIRESSPPSSVRDHHTSSRPPKDSLRPSQRSRASRSPSLIPSRREHLPHTRARSPASRSPRDWSPPSFSKDLNHRTSLRSSRDPVRPSPSSRASPSFPPSRREHHPSSSSSWKERSPPVRALQDSEASTSSWRDVPTSSRSMRHQSSQRERSLSPPYRRPSTSTNTSGEHGYKRDFDYKQDNGWGRRASARDEVDPIGRGTGYPTGRSGEQRSPQAHDRASYRTAPRSSDLPSIDNGWGKSKFTRRSTSPRRAKPIDDDRPAPKQSDDDWPTATENRPSSSNEPDPVEDEGWGQSTFSRRPKSPKRINPIDDDWPTPLTIPTSTTPQPASPNMIVDDDGWGVSTQSQPKSPALKPGDVFPEPEIEPLSADRGAVVQSLTHLSPEAIRAIDPVDHSIAADGLENIVPQVVREDGVDSVVSPISTSIEIPAALTNSARDAPENAPVQATTQAPEEALEEALEAAPEQARDLSPEEAPEQAPKQALDLSPEAALEEASEAAPEKTTEEAIGEADNAEPATTALGIADIAFHSHTSRSCEVSTVPQEQHKPLELQIRSSARPDWTHDSSLAARLRNPDANAASVEDFSLSDDVNSPEHRKKRYDQPLEKEEAADNSKSIVERIGSRIKPISSATSPVQNDKRGGGKKPTVSVTDAGQEHRSISGRIGDRSTASDVSKSAVSKIERRRSEDEELGSRIANTPQRSISTRLNPLSTSGKSNESSPMQTMSISERLNFRPSTRSRGGGVSPPSNKRQRDEQWTKQKALEPDSQPNAQFAKGGMPGSLATRLGMKSTRSAARVSDDHAEGERAHKRYRGAQ